MFHWRRDRTVTWSVQADSERVVGAAHTLRPRPAQELVVTSNHGLPAQPRVLLSGVFGPFGVDDAYGRKENVMELFHNQVTKAQGVASFRFQHRSFGLCTSWTRTSSRIAAAPWS